MPDDTAFGETSSLTASPDTKSLIKRPLRNQASSTAPEDDSKAGNNARPPAPNSNLAGTETVLHIGARTAPTTQRAPAPSDQPAHGSIPAAALISDATTFVQHDLHSLVATLTNSGLRAVHDYFALFAPQPYLDLQQRIIADYQQIWLDSAATATRMAYSFGERTR